MEAIIYDQSGKKVGTRDIPEAVFGDTWRPDLVYQVIQVMRANRRTNVAHTKDRSEVSGGGRKPWRQKGTGRARHGSNRSPIWVGGGVTHGPRAEKNYSRNINKKMKTRALQSVLSAKWRDGEILFVDDLTLSEPKTKDMAVFLKQMSEATSIPALTYKTGNRALVATPELDRSVVKSFNNIPQTRTIEVSDLNPLDVLLYKYLIIVRPESSLDILTKRLKV